MPASGLPFSPLLPIPLLRIALACIGSVIATSASAQAVQYWPRITVSGPVADGVLATGELNGRAADDSHTSQLVMRFMLGHPIGSHINGWIGWAHSESYLPDAPVRHENNFLEQLNWDIGKVGPMRLSTRTRLEQRFISNTAGTSWRWRQMVRVAFPLGNKRAPSLAIWAEPFIALNETSAQRRTLDQLRIFAGISVPVSPHVDVELGYLNQRIYRAGATVVNDAIPVNVAIHF